MYASRGRVEVDDTTDKRLKRTIHKRLLVIMILTYFLQALDKGTMSFSSIMGIKTDAHLEDGQKYSWLTTCIYIAALIVEGDLLQTQNRLQGSQLHSLPRLGRATLPHRVECTSGLLCMLDRGRHLPAILLDSSEQEEGCDARRCWA